jgi:sarcosine oxidase
MAGYDAIVVGLGAMGSAATYQLALRGAKVLGLDRFTPPHGWGSSHGRSRIIREAYWEHPQYVPMVQRAFTLWSDLQAACGRRILSHTGGLMLGQRDGPMIQGALRSAHAHGLPYELLTAAESYQRFPGFRPTVDMVGVHEPRAGVLFPEAAIETQLRLARGCGAELRLDEPLESWAAAADGVVVHTARARYSSARLVLSVGAWLDRLVPELRPLLTVERTVLYWFRPERPGLYGPERFPIFLCEDSPGRLWYGFPDMGDGVKVALHHQGEPADPEALRREVSREEVEHMRALLQAFMPSAAGPLASAEVCMYTNTPDEHFIIDVHPRQPAVLLVSACSGHGFKFSSAIGEMVAEMLQAGRTGLDVGPFRLNRFPGVTSPVGAA